MSVRKLAAFLILACSLCLHAQSNSRAIDFTQKLVGFDGKPLMVEDAPKQIPMTLRDVCATVLNAPLEEDKKETLAQSYARGDLIKRIVTTDSFELGSKEIAEILDRLEKYQNYTAIIKRIVPPLLDPVTYKP